jgi:glycosyltransferase involved in cell wall biosynthesis
MACTSDIHLMIATARQQPLTSTQCCNVLFIIDQLCEMGGAERVLLNMIRLLPRERFAPQLVTFKVEPELGIFANFPCPFHLFPLRRTWDAKAVRTAWHINRLIRREQIDIVHTFFETADIWGGTIARLSGVKALVSSRRDMGILRSFKHRSAYRIINRFYDEIQTVSEQVRDYCIEQDRIDPAKVVTLYNGVDVDKAANAKPARAYEVLPELRRASHIVTTVAHVRKIKGIDILLHAAAKIRRVLPGVAFVVVGDNHQPSHFSELMDLRRTLKLEDCVHFPGPVEEVFSILKASDLFFLPSRSEGLSNALLEAMACGLPCVATAVGGNPELVRDGENGVLVPAEDAVRAAEAIVSLLRDPVTIGRMGLHGRAIVEQQFTAGAMMQQLVRSYERVLDQHPTELG